ncbi:MAG: dynamin family protein [Kofleriaceae bacterium]
MHRNVRHDRMMDDEPESDAHEAAASSGGLNPDHVRVLAAGLSHLEESFATIERALLGRGSTLSRYVDDLAPEQRTIAVDYIEQIRERLAIAARTLKLSAPARIPISRSLHTIVTSAKITLEDLSPRRLRGYGPLDATEAELVASVASDLDRALERFAEFLARPTPNDLHERIARLTADPDQLEMVSALERIASRNMLVELRPAIAALIELFEVRTFEVAVFGRVSCGKSSLLNWVVGQQVLPVGATPVTALPTRLRYGETLAGIVSYADRDQRMTIAELAGLITEAGNPGNKRGVLRATVELPARVLLEGLVLVDTPGVGSLAAHAARETYNYLPRCDLGVLLIDASSTPGRDDLDLLRRLDASGIPAQVVLSKADLVPESEHPRVLAYFAAELERALGRAIPVDLVSATLETRLAKQWLASRIEPLSTRAAQAHRESGARKLTALHASMLAILRTAVARRAGRPDEPASGDEVERLALDAESQLRELDHHAALLLEKFAHIADEAIETATRRIHLAEASEATALLVTSLTDTANEIRRSFETGLVSARARLREIFAELARLAPGVSDTNLHVDLVSQPALELSAAVRELVLDVPHWPAAERRLRSRIESAVGADIRAAFDKLETALKRWSREAIEQVATQVAARVEPARASGRPSIRVATADLEADLATLEGL